MAIPRSSPNNQSSRAQTLPRPETPEDGYLLIAVLFLLILVLLTLGIAAPKVAVDLQRDREIEAIHRGHEYARAIGVFYRKFGRYPASIDQLISTNNQRFLRKRYLDPLTGKDDWRLIHYGEAVGGGNTLNQNNIPGSSAPGSPIGATGTGSTDSSSTNPGATSPSSGTNSSANGGSLFGGGAGSSGGGSSSPFGGSSGSGSIFGSGGGQSASPFGGGQSGTGQSGSFFGGGQSGTGTGSSPFGTPGVSSGGAPIVGVGLPSKKQSIKTLKKQTHYNKWEFVYDPAAEQNAALNFGAQQNGNGLNGTGSNGLNGNGGSGGFNSPTSPMSPTAPTSPTGGGSGSSSPFTNTQ